MQQSLKGHLVVVPSFRVKVNENGTIVLGKKFITGVNAYVARWPGPVTVLLESSSTVQANLDDVHVYSSDLAFNVAFTSSLGSRDMYSELTAASLVLGSPDYRLLGMHRRLNKLRVPNVAITENTLKTRLQAIKQQDINVLRKARQMLWNVQYERNFERDLRCATAIQCNGVPTYEAYAATNSNRLLYFDTRTLEAHLAAKAEMQQREARIKLPRAPMQLAFSGRLAAIKGVQLLPTLMHKLREMLVPVELKIFGDGELKQKIQDDIVRLGLQDRVTLMGSVDFSSELIPHLRRETDLFVAPHLQGDPSCTYLETLACGVPIVGFNNEAWSGILGRAAVGWSAQLGDVQALAERIRFVFENKNDWLTKSIVAAEFAREHTLEKTFDRRVAHLVHTSYTTLARR